MKRRLFVKQTSIVSLGILTFSGLKTQANNTENKNTVINFLPLTNASKKITLRGTIVDAITKMPIENSTMTVKAKANRLFNSTKEIVSNNGEYSILSGFSEEGKIVKKMEVEIKASGYKTFKGFIYLTTNGCNLHSDTWNYNKNFDYNHGPKNIVDGSQILSEFNFQLVK